MKRVQKNICTRIHFPVFSSSRNLHNSSLTHSLCVEMSTPLTRDQTTQQIRKETEQWTTVGKASTKVPKDSDHQVRRVLCPHCKTKKDEHTFHKGFTACQTCVHMAGPKKCKTEGCAGELRLLAEEVFCQSCLSPDTKYVTKRCKICKKNTSIPPWNKNCFHCNSNRCTNCSRYIIDHTDKDATLCLKCEKPNPETLPMMVPIMSNNPNPSKGWGVAPQTLQITAPTRQGKSEQPPKDPAIASDPTPQANPQVKTRTDASSVVPAAPAEANKVAPLGPTAPAIVLSATPEANPTDNIYSITVHGTEVVIRNSSSIIPKYTTSFEMNRIVVTFGEANPTGNIYSITVHGTEVVIRNSSSTKYTTSVEKNRIVMTQV